MVALHGSGIAELVERSPARMPRPREFGTARLTRLEKAYADYQPPLVRGHAPKLRFAHPGGSNPPTIVIHGSRTKHVAEGYQRYLQNFFRKRFKLEGTPVRIAFRESENPFADRKNVLTERQVKVSIGCLWNRLQFLELPLKKNRNELPSRIDRMSRQPAKNGAPARAS